MVMQENIIATLADNEQETMLRWIDVHWNTLAGFAWRSYVTSGRGIVVLQGDWGGDVFVAYQTLDLIEDWSHEIKQVVDCYEPRTDMVFLVQRPSTAILLGVRTPPERQPPYKVGQQDGAPPLVRAA
jgi:hypothetical protein